MTSYILSKCGLWLHCEWACAFSDVLLGQMISYILNNCASVFHFVWAQASPFCFWLIVKNKFGGVCLFDVQCWPLLGFVWTVENWVNILRLSLFTGIFQLHFRIHSCSLSSFYAQEYVINNANTVVNIWSNYSCKIKIYYFNSVLRVREVEFRKGDIKMIQFLLNRGWRWRRRVYSVALQHC